MKTENMNSVMTCSVGKKYPSLITLQIVGKVQKVNPKLCRMQIDFQFGTAYMTELLVNAIK